MRVLLNRALLDRAWRAAQIEARLEADLPRIAARDVSPYAWIESVLEA